MNEYYFGETLYDLSILNEAEDGVKNATREEVSGNISGDTSTEKTPEETTETPAEETPAEETPGEETPGEETPSNSSIDDIKVDDDIKNIVYLKDISSLGKKVFAISCLSDDGWSKAIDKGDFDKDNVDTVNKLLSSFSKSLESKKPKADSSTAKKDSKNGVDTSTAEEIKTLFQNIGTLIVKAYGVK